MINQPGLSSDPIFAGIGNFPRVLHFACRVSVLRFQIGDIIKEMRSRIGRFTSWSKKIVEDPQIMGGAPVFPGSRLTVKRVAELLASGESQGTILEDYPYLNAEGLEFAPLYEKAFPKVGRPPRARQAAD